MTLKRYKSDVLHLRLDSSCVLIQLYNVTLKSLDFHSRFSSSEVLASLGGSLNVGNIVVQYMWTEH